MAKTRRPQPGMLGNGMARNAGRAMKRERQRMNGALMDEVARMEGAKPRRRKPQDQPPRSHAEFEQLGNDNAHATQ